MQNGGTVTPVTLRMARCQAPVGGSAPLSESGYFAIGWAGVITDNSSANKSLYRKYRLMNARSGQSSSRTFVRMTSALCAVRSMTWAELPVLRIFRVPSAQT